MIDDSDVDFAILMGPGKTLGGFIAWVIIVILLAFFAYQNGEECAQKHCPNGGVPRLMEHECLCVGEAQEAQ